MGVAPTAVGGLARRQGNNLLLWGGIGGGVLFLLVLVLVIVMNSGGESPGNAGAVEGSTQVASQSGSPGGVKADPLPATPLPANSSTGAANTGINRVNTSGAGGTTANSGTRPSRGTTPPVAVEAAPKGLQQTVIPDDGKSLWESPTAGAPVEFQWVPPGGQIFILLRPNDLTRSTEGARVLRALGPTLASQLADWEKAAGTPFASIESLIMTLHDNGEEYPRPSFVVRMSDEVTGDSWAERWKAESAGESDKAQLFAGGSWLYCVPKAAGNRLFVMGAKDDVEESAKVGGAPPALRREVDRLRRMTDDQRHLTILFAPNYLASTMFRDGRSFYFGEARRVREPLDWFLRDELQGALFSLHTAGDTYLELRLTSNLNKDRFTLAKEFQDRLEQVPDLAFDYIATLGSNPYWERVRLQFPNMIRFLHGKTRIGVEEDTATINARLPGPAAHNLVFGSEMLLMSQPGASPVAVASKPMPMAGNMGGMSPASMTIEDVLSKYKTNVSFEAMSIEHALLDLAKGVNEDLKGLPFEFKIKVAGEDLRLDGITRNQTVRDFMQKDRTIGEILTAMVMKANPVTTVKEPSEKDQKLLWVVEKDPEDPSKTIVLVTTRAVSDQKGYKLPAVFQLK